MALLARYVGVAELEQVAHAQRIGIHAQAARNHVDRDSEAQLVWVPPKPRNGPAGRAVLVITHSQGAVDVSHRYGPGMR